MVYNYKKILCFLLVLLGLSVAAFASNNKNYLEVVYPKNDATINAASTFFVGSTNPKAKLTINDKPVTVYSNGAFVWVYELKNGKNDIVLKSVINNHVKTKKISINKKIHKKLVNKEIPKEIFFEKDIIITEKEAPLRALPYGDRLTPIKAGMICHSVGLINNHYKVKYDDKYAYILQAFADTSEVTKEEKQVAESIFFNEDEKNIIMKIKLKQPTMLKINNIDNKLYLKLLDTRLNFDKVITKSPYIKNFTYNNDEMMLELTANYLNGYDYYYDENTLAVTIRKPFKSGLKGKIIAIDAGHGGKELGAVGPTGVPEKNINIAISNYLKEELEKSGATVIMTRTDDSYVDLYDRVGYAQDKAADILVSIHNNSLPDGQNPYIVHGTETYYFQPQAIPLANAVQSSLLTKTGFKNLGVKKSSFVLTRPTNPVSILVEVGFMINPLEYQSLLLPKNQKKYALGIKNGIEKYFNN